MQQGLPVADVLEGRVDVSLGGVAVDPLGLSVDREFSDSLPGGGSFTAASGQVSYVPGPDVSEKVSTPWDPTPGVPAPEAAVSVSMDVGMGPVSLVPNGRVADASAGTDSRVVRVGFTDLYRSLDRSISWEPMAARMPAQDGEYWRNPGLFGVSVVDRIFRHCGWYATPPLAPGAVLSAPMQGSAWAELGTMTAADRLTAPGAAPGWITSPWGMQATDANLTYTPASTMALADKPIEITAMLPASSGTARIICWMGDRRIQLVWTDASVYVSLETGAGTFVTAVTAARDASELVVTGRVWRVASGQIAAELRFDSGRTVTGSTITLTEPQLNGSVLGNVNVLANGRVGAFQVAFANVPYQVVTGWKPSAVIRARAGVPNRLQVLPPVIGQNCASMLQELAQAEYATFWVDELGVMQWWDIDRLEAQSTVATLTTADHVTGLSWAHSLSSVHRRAVVEWSEPSIEASFRNRVEFWRGGGGSLTVGGGELIEEIVASPGDEVWLMPDLAPSEIGFQGTMDDYNLSIGSWFGGVYDNTGTWSSGAHVTMTGIGPGAFKIRTTTRASGTVRTMVQKTAPESVNSAIWLGRRGENLPILRGKLKFTLVDADAVSSQSGPPFAPEFTINAGWWIQYADEAQWLADKYGSRVTVASPEMDAVTIKPFPGLQLGDRVTISAPHVVGLQIQGIVFADSRSISAGDSLSMSHTIRVRPVSISSNGGVTWQAWRDAMAANMTHTQWAGTQAGESFQQWGASPLT